MKATIIYNSSNRACRGTSPSLTRQPSSTRGRSRTMTSAGARPLIIGRRPAHWNRRTWPAKKISTDTTASRPIKTQSQDTQSKDKTMGTLGTGKQIWECQRLDKTTVIASSGLENHLTAISRTLTTILLTWGLVSCNPQFCTIRPTIRIREIRAALIQIPSKVSAFAHFFCHKNWLSLQTPRNYIFLTQFLLFWAWQVISYEPLTDEITHKH